jgi:hypothetical protein
MTNHNNGWDGMVRAPDDQPQPWVGMVRAPDDQPQQWVGWSMGGMACTP